MLRASSVANARVLGMTPAGEEVNELGETVSLVNVKCATPPKIRVIQKKEGELDWCSVDVPTVCSRNKIGAGTRVCRFGFKQQVDAYNAQNAPDPEIELKKEQIRIEQERLRLRREQLEQNRKLLEQQAQ